MTLHQQRKELIRAHLRKNFTNQVLADLLAHTQDGKLSYCSCCCLRGFYTADHPYMGENSHWFGGHYMLANDPAAVNAAPAYSELGGGQRFKDLTGADNLRRRILIPMILAEMRRRDRFEAPAVEVNDTTRSRVPATV
jgi:hypothetical protein